ncbi:MAG: FtsX-like permease family protein [Treponema sp.]|nr:FtsX-like permease family protein [Treponema sp.]
MVSKSGFRLVQRKIKTHIPQLLGLILLLTVGVCFFITLFTIVLRFEETAEQYFIDNAYADITFYGVFDEESVRTLIEFNGVLSAQGRTVRDYRETISNRETTLNDITTNINECIIRAISLTDINIPYIYEGRFPENETECVLLKRNAKAIGLSIGDSIKLGGKSLVITGLAASPEYIYMVQNERTMMAQPNRFAVVYVTKDFFHEDSASPQNELSQKYNEIVVLSDNNISIPAASQAIGAFRTELQKDQINHYLYRNDLEEIRSFAYIFPFVFAVLIAVVIYVMLSRTIQKDRKQIGIMKALGVPDKKIIGIYLSQFCIAAFAGALLGCGAAVIITDGIIGIFSSMFEVPALGFVFYPGLWLIAVLVSVSLCIVSGFLSLLPILPLLPANAMRPRLPKGGKRIFIERIGFIWKKLSFNSRYALKNTLRNKGRFLAVVLGMCGSCALLAFSLGFYDSIGNTQNKYFNEFANYDLIVSFDPIPHQITHPALKQIEKSNRALMMPVSVQPDLRYPPVGSYIIAITEKDFDMVNIPGEALYNGIIVPEYFANEWRIKSGDKLSIEGHIFIVSAIIPQYLGLTLYTSFDYINSITDELPPLYNTIFGRSNNLTALSVYLKENNITFTTIDDDKTSFDSIMESMSVLIWFMIACSVVLGFTVLYSVGLINLSAREYEYMFMGVMGYPHKSILLAHIKETILQLVLAIPLGFLLGNVLLESIKGEFSSGNFVIASTIYPQSYLFSALSVIGVTAVMALVTSRHINKLDIVEGLKIRDE